MSDITDDLTCTECGAELRAGMLRCRECGAERAPGARADSADVPSDAPRGRKKKSNQKASVGTRRPLRHPEENVARIESSQTGGPDAQNDPEGPGGPASEGAESGEAATRERSGVVARLLSSALSGRAAVGVSVFALLAIVGYVLWSRPRTAGIPKEALRALVARGESFNAVVFSRDGRRLAAGAASGRVLVWNGVDDELKPLNDRGSEPVIALAPGAGAFLYAGAADGMLFGWDKAFADGESKVQRQKVGESALTAVAVRPGAPGLALGSARGDLLILGGRAAVTKATNQLGVRVMAYTNEGDFLVTGGADGRLFWRNPESGDLIGEPFSLTAEIGGLAFGPDGALAAGDWNGRIEVFDKGSRKPARTLNQPNAVSGLVFAGDLIVTSSWDGRLRFWSRTGESPILTLDAGRPLAGLAINPTGDRLATPTADGLVLIWSAKP